MNDVQLCTPTIVYRLFILPVQWLAFFSFLYFLTFQISSNTPNPPIPPSVFGSTTFSTFIPIHELVSQETLILRWMCECTRQYTGAGIPQWWECSPPTHVALVRFRPGAICGLSLLSVLALLGRFLSGLYGFPPSQKPALQIPDIGPTWKAAKAELSSPPNIVIYLLFYDLRNLQSKRSHFRLF